MYFFLLIVVVVLPAATLLTVNIINSKKGLRCETARMELSAVSKLRFDDTNVVKQGSNALLLAGSAFILSVFIIFVIIVWGGVNGIDITSFLFLSALTLMSEYLLFSYFNFAFYLYENEFVYRDIYRKTHKCKYADTEFNKANRLVVAVFNNKKVTIQFDCINIEKLLVKCGLPLDTIKSYGAKERYKVNQVNPDELLNKGKRDKGGSVDASKAVAPEKESNSKTDVPVAKTDEADDKTDVNG